MSTDVQAIRELLGNITPGPWEYSGNDMIWFRCTVGDENAEFIAAAPTIVADLLAEVDRLRGKLAAVRETIATEILAERSGADSIVRRAVLVEAAKIARGVS